VPAQITEVRTGAILVLTESVLEFIAAAIAPFLYRSWHAYCGSRRKDGTRRPADFQARSLSIFTFRAYFISNIVALLFYSVLLVAVWVADVGGIPMYVALITALGLQVT
jgi:hypothetical protein